MFPQCMTEVVLNAILDKSITPGVYKTLFSWNTELSENILNLLTERKKTAFFALRNGKGGDPEVLKDLSENMHKVFDEFEGVSAFLTKAKSDNPDAVCGCSSVSCTETHAE